MRALQLTGPGTLALREVPIPELGPTDLLLKVGAAGIRHSDSFVLGLPFSLRDDPLTMGHEIAGTIEAVGTEVEGRRAGERGLVYLCWSCGVCRECVSGNENVCLAAGRTAMPPCPGLGPDGGMAEYVRIPANSFVPIGAYRMVGLDAGPAGGPGLPWGATVRKSYGGTKGDLYASVALAQRGAIDVSVERFDLAEGPAAFERLDRGVIRGCAVLIPRAESEGYDASCRPAGHRRPDHRRPHRSRWAVRAGRRRGTGRADSGDAQSAAQYGRAVPRGHGLG